MENDSGQELTEEYLIFSQIQRISNINANIYLDKSVDWQTGVRNFVESVNLLEAAVVRHLDAEYIRKKRILRKKMQERLLNHRAANPADSKTAIGRQAEVDLQILYSRLHLALILKTLDAKGVLRERSYSAIEGIQHKKGGDDE